MNEAETRAELIDPTLKAAGWGVVEASRVRREVITLGRLQGAGVRAAQDIADYVLTYRNHKLAVIEAKRRDLPDTEGVGQAKKYAEKLQTRFAYATNGAGIYQVDMTTGAEQYVAQYPTPDELWNQVFAEQNIWRDRFAAIPFEDKGGYWQARYYQDIAIRRALEAIAAGQDRILLTLPFSSPGSCSRAGGTSPTGSVMASPPGGRASCSWPTATSSPTRPTTRSRPSRKTRSCGSTPTSSAGGAVCRRTATSSSPSSRPS
jgi:hypothetical protein